jgi:hypothetical protein
MVYAGSPAETAARCSHRAQRGIVRGLLVGERDRDLRHVGVLDVGELLRRGRLQPLDAADGQIQLVGHGPGVGLQAGECVQVRVEVFQVGGAQRLHGRRGAFVQVLDDRAQRVEQLAVPGFLAVAQHPGQFDAHVDRRAGAECARDRFGVALIGVVFSLFVGARRGECSAEDVLAGVLSVGVLLDAFGELLHLGGDVAQIRRAVDFVGGLQDQLAHPLHLVVDVRHRAAGDVHPGDPVLGAVFVGGEAGELALERDRETGPIRIVRRLADPFAARQLLLGPGQPAERVVDVRNRQLRGHQRGDPLGHSPTVPVWLISVSSIASIVVMTREDAW